MLNESQSLLSDIVVYTKYSRYRKDLKRRETWEEIIDRYVGMMLRKHCGKEYQDQWKKKKVDVSKSPLAKEIIENSQYLYDKDVLPSMRSLQFAGPAIEKNESRGYNCFGRETQFITSKGVKSFEEFDHNDECIVLTHTGEWKSAIVKNYGCQPLHYVKLSKGRSTKTINVTRNHRWILRDGSSTTNLEKGNILIKTPNIFSEFDYYTASPDERLYWAYGFVYGDGTRCKDKKGEYKYSMLRLCGSDIEYEDRFLELGFKTSSSNSLDGDIMVYTGKYLKTTPDLSKDLPNLVRAFCAGYCDADGAKNINYVRDNSSKFKGIQSSEEDHISFIRNAFEVAGLYITLERDLIGEITNFGIRGITSYFGLYNNMSGNHAAAMWSVTSIDEIANSVDKDVWCLEVEDNHSFVLSGGIVTGNCCFLPIDSYHSFSELMFLLLGGTGVGYSVQSQHVDKLPEISKPNKERKYLIGDSIEGWADAVKELMKAYFGITKYKPRFDFADIRPKGEALITAGGKAPGPDPLRLCLVKIETILNQKEDGSKLSTLESHDICCHIADAVLAGGIRRAALISLFNFDDIEMATCKHGSWWEMNPQRGRANNSAVIVRNRVIKKEFKAFWELIKASGSGEPGIYFTNDASNYGTNPCCEVSLREYQFCNLTEINAGTIKTQEDFNERSKIAAFFGTLQAGFTDFHYLRPIWRQNTEKDALIGVGITGVGNGTLEELDLENASEIVKQENLRVSKLIGINIAARATVIKPSGTTSCVVGTSSGIHAWHNDYYIRNIQCSVGDDLYNYFTKHHPDLIKIMDYQPHSAVIGIPMKAPSTAIMRYSETAIEFLERVKRFNLEWVRTGHYSGPNYNNVSATVNIRRYEWDNVRDWMWENRKTYSGISVIPYDTGTYADAPFQDCSEYEYNKRMKYIRDNPINLTRIKEVDDNTTLNAELACAGGECTLTY